MGPDPILDPISAPARYLRLRPQRCEILETIFAFERVKSHKEICCDFRNLEKLSKVSASR